MYISILSHFEFFFIIYYYSYVPYVCISILSLLTAFYYNTLLFLCILCVPFYSITSYWFFLLYIAILMYPMCTFLCYHSFVFFIIHCYSYVPYLYLSILSHLIGFFYQTLVFLYTLCVPFYPITLYFFIL